MLLLCFYTVHLSVMLTMSFKDCVMSGAALPAGRKFIGLNYFIIQILPDCIVTTSGGVLSVSILVPHVDVAFCETPHQATSIWYLLFLAPEAECGEILTQRSGWITSPDLDEDGFYDFNLRCSWSIEVDEDKAISFRILYIDLWPAPDCVADNLDVSGLVLQVYISTRRYAEALWSSG